MESSLTFWSLLKNTTFATSLFGSATVVVKVTVAGASNIVPFAGLSIVTTGASGFGGSFHA